MLYEKLFCNALLETVAVETVIITLFIRLIFRISKNDLPLARIIVAGIVPTLATLPYFWLVAPAFISSFWIRTIGCEIAITAVETVILRYMLPFSWIKSGILSLTANSGSIIAGLLLTRILAG